MSDFYIVLPSNVKTGDKNTQSLFLTRLHKRILLESNWEVGLAEISYTDSWYNLPFPVYYRLKTFHRKNHIPVTLSPQLHLPEGRYENIETIVNAINLTIEEFYKDHDDIKRDTWTRGADDGHFNTILPKLEISQKTRKIKIHNGYANNLLLYIDFDDYLCNMLGIYKEKYDEYFKKEMGVFVDNYDDQKYNQKLGMNVFMYTPFELRGYDFQLFNPEWITTKWKYTADAPYDLNCGFHTLFVLTDIVSPTIFGNGESRLLRVVDIPSDTKYGMQHLLHYASPYYVPMITNDFDTITIEIHDDTGEIVPFKFGRTIVTLHFRQKL